MEQVEIERLFEAIESLRYATTRDFLQLCLFTGARRGNVMAMRWDQNSFERKTWSIPITKNGTSQLLPLTDLAVEVLKRRKQQANESDQWVFPSDRSRSGHLTKPEGAWQMILERAGLENVRIHDLRRTLASWEALTGANISTIAATLNHKDLKSTAIYARLNTDAVRTAMNTAVHAMTGQASPAASPGRPSEKPGSDQNKCAGLAEEECLNIQRKTQSQFRYGIGVNHKGEAVLMAEEIKVIHTIFEMRQSGISLGEIASALNKRLIYRRGRPWNKSDIDYLLNQKPKYLYAILRNGKHE